MSKINAADTRIINSAEDIIDVYCCSGEDAMAGVEVELCYIDPNTPDLDIMTPEQNEIIMSAAIKEFGAGAFNNEPSSDFLEANSIPGKFKDLEDIFDDIYQKTAFLDAQAEKLGLKRCYFQDLPHKTAKDLLKSIVNIDRYQAFFAPPREDMTDIATYFTVTKSTQVSISYKNYDHMLANVRRLYLLAPFLFLLTDNSSGFDQGTEFRGHAGMHHRASLGERGGFPAYIFTAQNGEDYIHSHINHVMNNPMYVYYDQAGTLTRLPSGTWWTFNKELREQGLNTAANYYLAQSILWPDVKIAPIKNKNNEITHHRYEARMFGVGIHQPQTALLIVAGLAFDENFSAAIDQLLVESGLCTKNGEQCIQHLQNAYDSARNHNGKFFDIPYGTGQMTDFAKKFGLALTNSKTYQRYAAHCEPTIDICSTNRSDGAVSRQNNKNLPDIKSFLKAYDTNIFKNPNQNGNGAFAQKNQNKSA